MPPKNPEAIIHYEDTIQKRVSLDRIKPHVSSTLATKLESIFGTDLIAVWGSNNSKANRAKFESMHEGDEVLIVKGKIIKFHGRIGDKVISAGLSPELWHDLAGGPRAQSWDLIYFIVNPMEIEVPFAEFCSLVDYKSDFQLHGFTKVSNARLTRFYQKYTDLYSIVTRLAERY